MIEELFENNKRTQRIQHIDTDLLVAGGGGGGGGARPPALPFTLSLSGQTPIFC